MGVCMSVCMVWHSVEEIPDEPIYYLARTTGTGRPKLAVALRFALLPRLSPTSGTCDAGDRTLALVSNSIWDVP